MEITMLKQTNVEARKYLCNVGYKIRTQHLLFLPTFLINTRDVIQIWDYVMSPKLSLCKLSEKEESQQINKLFQQCDNYNSPCLVVSYVALFVKI